MRKKYGIGIDNGHTFVLFTGTVFRQFIFHWNKNCKGFRCYTYHTALNDEISINNKIDVCKFFIGITINC